MSFVELSHLWLCCRVVANFLFYMEYSHRIQRETLFLSVKLDIIQKYNSEGHGKFLKSIHKINKHLGINVTYSAKKSRHNQQNCSWLFVQESEGKNQEIQRHIKDIGWIVYSSSCFEYISEWLVVKQKAWQITKVLNKKI